MRCHVEMLDASAFVSQEEEDVQEPEAQGWHHEEVDRHQLLHVLFQECPGR
jgi:hypothetical protein